MNDHRTATEIMMEESDNRARELNLREMLLRVRTEEEKHAIRRPTVAVVPFDGYLRLKCEVLRSVAEVFPVGEDPLSPPTTGSPYNLLAPLNQAGVECFAWNGMIIIGAKSPGCRGVFFL